MPPRWRLCSDGRKGSRCSAFGLALVALGERGGGGSLRAAALAAVFFGALAPMPGEV